MGDGKQHMFGEVFSTISLLTQFFPNPLKRWWSYFVFFSLFFFPGKREIKVIHWLSDLTSSPHYIFSSLLCLTSAKMCSSFAQVRDSLGRILSTLFHPEL